MDKDIALMSRHWLIVIIRQFTYGKSMIIVTYFKVGLFHNYYTVYDMDQLQISFNPAITSK